MTIIFVGGEDTEMLPSGTCSIDTATTGVRRSTYSRCSLKIGPLAANQQTDQWIAPLPSPRSTFWFTGRFYAGNGGNNGYGDGITLSSGINKKLYIGQNASGTSPWVLTKRANSGTFTTLQTSGINTTNNTVTKLDVSVTYGTSGNITVWMDGVQVLNYSGDVTTDGATTLDAIGFGTLTAQFTASSSSPNYWSEIIVADEDTRSMSLATLTPLAAGNSQTWTGAVTDINEATLSDASVLSTSSANQLAEFTVTPASVIGSTTPIRAIVVNARASKGATGPQNLQAVVRTGSTDYPSSNLTVPLILGPVSNVWNSNPNTSAPWVGSDITAAGFNIGLKSIT